MVYNNCTFNKMQRNIKSFNRYNYFRKTIIYTKIIKYIIYERI